jgi:hypothetical protein
MYELLQTILKEMKTSIGAHKTIDALGSSEQFFEFVRALFMISLALAFSPVPQDLKLAEYIQQLSLDLYFHLCNHNKVQRVARLGHSAKSVKLMNASLTLLGLPNLVGVLEEEAGTMDSEESRRLEKQDFSKRSGISEIQREGRRENNNLATDNQGAETSGPNCDRDRDLSNLNLSKDKGTSSLRTSNVEYAGNQGHSKTEGSYCDSLSAFDVKPIRAELHRTIDSAELEERQKTFRGWTYNFGHETRVDDNGYPGKKIYRTFPLSNQRKPLDPKKQWQTYKHKCVGLPVDPNFFASPVPSSERLQESNTDISSPDEDKESPPPLVNLSLPYIKKTLENRTNTTEFCNLVDRGKTTVSSSSSVDSTRLPLHPHDLPNQPMKQQRDDDGKKDNDDLDASIFTPLVDLGKTAMSDVLEASVGKSVSTTDAVEYINSWQPPLTEGLDEGNGIRRKYPCKHTASCQFVVRYCVQNCQVCVGLKNNDGVLNG